MRFSDWKIKKPTSILDLAYKKEKTHPSESSRMHSI